MVASAGQTAVVLAVGATLDPVFRATAGLDLVVLYASTVRLFDEAALRTAVLAAAHADVVLVEPVLPGTSARQVADTLVHVPHRRPAIGGADGRGRGEARPGRAGLPAVTGRWTARDAVPLLISHA